MPSMQSSMLSTVESRSCWPAWALFSTSSFVMVIYSHWRPWKEFHPQGWWRWLETKLASSGLWLQPRTICFNDLPVDGSWIEDWGAWTKNIQGIKAKYWGHQKNILGFSLEGEPRNKATRKWKHEATRTENFITPSHLVFGGERKVRGQRSEVKVLLLANAGLYLYSLSAYVSWFCTWPHNSGHALGSDFCHLGSCVFVHQVEMSRMDRQPADRESQRDFVS